MKLRIKWIFVFIYSPHDEHWFSGPRPVKFSVFIKNYIYKSIQEFVFGPVNSNFHFEDCVYVCTEYRRGFTNLHIYHITIC